MHSGNCILLFLALLDSGTALRCKNHACSPPMGNLATGRRLQTLTSCCGGPSPLCSAPSYPCSMSHPPGHMADDPFLHPGTWWASEAGVGEEEIRLDLDAQFCLTHLLMLFRSPRPAAMILERSRDSAQTWEPLKLFASNCSQTFGLPDDVSQPGAPCTSRYSQATPCSEGEAGLAFAMAMLSDVFPFQRPKARCTKVQGRCMCLHHTAGEHCEKCAPLFNDRPWRPANGSSGEPHACQKCECHSHADTCHFSPRAWQSSGGSSGGICDNCRHNTEGRRCQRCRPGYRRHPAKPLNSPHACTRCPCDPVGAVPARGKGLWCHPRSGHCHCRPGVGGMRCNHCLPGHWGFGDEGCKPCLCPQNCDPFTGHCENIQPREVVYHIPVGGKIPDVTHNPTNGNEGAWSEELAVSALHRAGKCTCKERKLRGVTDLCRMKYTYVIRATVLSAHDKGSHAEVRVKVRKVLRSGQVLLSQGTHTVYPLSWTSRGCTCPILNPGVDYLLAGPEETRLGRLLVTMQSVVLPWTPGLGYQVTKGLRQGCP
ncbi:hypothetical protein SKAU_G00176240 [Synaphobranchus kaupii]|uniref:Netrin-1 n=1 Tax=Synaphobranchus kaupii TaxID=118154 RepID=A0A9Q1FLE4_SYNKA|nr:hypothetical protein SKAU_G00176240 [Synaphobranchus kaupii]